MDNRYQKCNNLAPNMVRDATFCPALYIFFQQITIYKTKEPISQLNFFWKMDLPHSIIYQSFKTTCLSKYRTVPLITSLKIVTISRVEASTRPQKNNCIKNSKYKSPKHFFYNQPTKIHSFNVKIKYKERPVHI